MLFCAAIARRRMGDPCRQFLITTQHLIVLYELMHDTPFVRAGNKSMDMRTVSRPLDPSR